MNIADVRTIPLSYRCDVPYASAAGVQMARQALIVEVETDTGLIGIGEAGSAGGPLASSQAVVQHELKPLLIGEDPLRIEYLWQKMFQRSRQHGRRGIVMHGISGIDMALWDLAGKVASAASSTRWSRGLRPWETPDALPYPILRGMSRPRSAAPRLAACRFRRPPRRPGGAASAASG
jgi:hypothetical protein